MIAALAAALSLAGCAQYAKVAEKRPRFMPNPVGLGVLQGAEKAITNALRRDRREPLAALGEYPTAAEAAGATTPAQSRADLVEWARSAMLIEGSELASDVDFEIPRCVNTIEETVGLIRENRASWLASEQGK